MVQYHFRTKEGPSLGPIGVDEFRQHLEAGEIEEETMVWRSGMLDWTSYANLRSIEERAARPKSAEPPPLPPDAFPKKAAVAPTAPAARILPCGSCGQEWPENLMTPLGAKHICGNCQRQQKDNFKKSQLKNHASGVSGEWGTWLLKTVGMAVLCGSLIFTRVWLKQKRIQGSKAMREMRATPLPR